LARTFIILPPAGSFGPLGSFDAGPF